MKEWIFIVLSLKICSNLHGSLRKLIQHANADGGEGASVCFLCTFVIKHTFAEHLLIVRPCAGPHAGDENMEVEAACRRHYGP